MTNKKAQSVALIDALEINEKNRWPLHLLHQKAIIARVLNALDIPEIEKVAILLSPEWLERFKDILGPKVVYLTVGKAKDFGQAILQAEDWLNQFGLDVILAKANQPLLQPKHTRLLLNVPFTAETVGCIPRLSAPIAHSVGNWVLKMNDGKIVAVEKATNHEHTLNFTAFPWRFEWDCLQRALYQVETAQGKRPLQAIIEKVTDNGFEVKSVPFNNAHEFMSVNNHADLDRAERLLSKLGETNG